MLTRDQIRKEATTPEKALELSIQHWLENYEMTMELLKDPDYPPIAAGMCGLCRFYAVGDSCLSPDCGKCPMTPQCDSLVGLYTVARVAYEAFCTEQSKEHYQEWRKASKAMHKYLVSLRNTVQQSS